MIKCADHKSINEGEKTFAIIIGLLAGVALIIIFLAFLRKICEGGGKFYFFNYYYYFLYKGFTLINTFRM